MVANLTDLASTAMTVEYFAEEGYYAKNDPRQRRASFWHGAAARALGLPKHVSPRRFESILHGYVPGTDIRLGTARDGEFRHRPGFDLTLSAPKTVSLEALLHGDRRVLGAHDAAVKATLDWLERDLLQTRSYDPVTRQRPRVAANGLVAAGFRHLTSRDEDPQLHTHCILANMTRNRSGAWRSVEPTELRRNVRLIGAVYRQDLARRLLALGFRIESTMIGGVPGFEIAGYGRAFVDAFSSRRREILAWLDEHGLPWSAALTQQAALITRKKKTDKDIDDLRAEWKARVERLGLVRDRSIAKPGLGRKARATQKAARKAGRPYVRTAEELRPEPPGLSAREVVWRAVEHLAERASVVRETGIRALALGHAPGRHELGDIDAAVAGLVADGHLVEAQVRGGRSFATREALGLERAIMAHKRKSLGASQPVAEERRVSDRLAETMLTEGQKEAVRTILLSHDRIVAVQGAAGAGKTTMLKEALGLLGERKAVLLAPSAAAARVLREETGSRARTLQWFLTRHGDLGNAARVVRDRREHEGSVLVLDEASMVSTAEMALLLRVAERFRVARLVLVGDRRQLRAVSAGEPFRALQEAGVAVAEMEEILRQRDPALKAAVERLKEGRAREALQGLEHVHEVPQQELGAEAARIWLALDPGERERTAILAPTHFIRAEIHRVVRDGLAREGVLHGRELELERYVNRRLTAAQRADLRNHEPGDIVLFHSRVAPLRVEKGDACRVARREGERVFLEHPAGRTLHIRPGDNWVRYRFGLYETARIRIRAGDRIRWTMNDERRGLVNGGEAVVREIGPRRVKFDLEDGRTLSLARTDPQLRHIDHAWSSTVHAAQGMTRDGAIGVLDTGHGALAGQASLYVEASRARDRFVLVTNDRERLEEVLEAHDGSRMTALEAVGEGKDPPPGAPGAALAMLRGLEADWRRLVSQADSQGREPARMDGYARIVTGAAMLAEDMALPADLRAFVEEVGRRDAQAVAERKRGFAFLRRAERHCRDWPLLKWAAAKRGRPLAALPEHAAWLAEGEALADTGRELHAGSGRGIAARVAAALRRLVKSRDVDEAERFREAAARHEAEARAAGQGPREAAGAEALAAWARRLRGRELPEAARPAVEAWRAADAERGAASGTPETPEDRKAALAIEAFLLDCDDLLIDIGSRGAGPPVGAAEPDPWEERAEALRRQGLGMLGDAPGAKLDDPLRIRLARGGTEREWVREAVDGLARAALQRRSDRFMALVGTTVRQRREAGSDAVDLPSWAALRDRAAALRSEASLAPGVRRAVDRVLDLNARARAETRPVEAFLEAGDEHLRRREALEEKAREAGIAPVLLEDMAAWREGSEDIRAAGRLLLGGAEAGAAEARAASRLKDMPRLRNRVREVLDGLGAAQLRDAGDAFIALADRVEARAVREDTLALHAEEYGQATAIAKDLETLEALPEAARRRVGDWLARDRRWSGDLAAAARLVGAEGRQAGPAARREAAARPVVAEAIRREAARLARLPEPEGAVPWTGEEPLVPGDRVRIGSGRDLVEAVVVSAGQAGGARPDDELELRMLVPAGPASPPAMGPQVPYLARSMAAGGCESAVWSDEGLRELALARQQSAPSELCRTPCAEPVEGDRIAWTEDAGQGRVRTVEAQVTARADDIRYGGPRLELEVLDASGPGAPEPGSDIERTAAAVAARGCFRAQWSDEAERERILDPPVEEKSLKRERTQARTIDIDLSEDLGMSM